MEKTVKKVIVYNTEEEKRKGENGVLTSDNTKAYPRIPLVLI